MRTIQLPLAPPIDLTKRETWVWWNTEPPPQWQYRGVEFWATMTGLTIPQEMALRSGRTPDLVSIQTISGSFRRRSENDHKLRWECYHLRRYPTIWQRTHSATCFRVVPGRGQGRMADDNPLHAVLAWAEPEDVFEDRFLMAGYDQGWGHRRRRDNVRMTLRNAERRRFITDVHEVVVTPRVWVPHPKWCSKHSIPRPRIKDAALDHGALAVEAALMRQGFRDTTAAVTALRSEADLVSETRWKAGRKVAAGMRFDAIPDLEIVTRGDQRYAIEVLSDNYRNADLAAKYAAIQRSVEYVATSRTVAERVLRVNPTATCYHF